MLIEVFTKEKFAENENKSLIKKFSHSLKNVKKVRESKLYFIEGAYSLTETKKIAEEILSDKIVESFSLKPRSFIGSFLRFEIWFKDGITDVVAESVTDAIESYGFKKPKRVRTGKAIYIFGEEKQKAEKAVRKIFINPLIHKLKTD